MERIFDFLDFYPERWNENQKARVTIWVILFILMTVVCWLSWETLYHFPNKLNERNAVIDSMSVRLKEISRNDSMRVSIDKERQKAMIDWRESFKRDEERKKKWDQRFKKEAKQ